MRRSARMVLKLAAIAALSPPIATSAQDSPPTSIDLSGPFATRGHWRFTATQGAPVPDPTGFEENLVPGPIHLCLSADLGKTCSPDVQHALGTDPDDLFSEPHYLETARVVHPDGKRALLLLQVASVHSTNGDQVKATLALSYHRRDDRFGFAFLKRTRRNNNQEIRYVEAGPLRGAIITAEPTSDAPYAYWITVDRPGPTLSYRQVLRYRSATHYGDGNPLAVIDSEMPAIQRRLGLWLPGMPLPLPPGPCARPHLVGQELWC